MEISMMDVPDSEDTLRRELLRVQRRVNGTGVVVHVAGELDLTTAPVLVGELTLARAEATPPGPLVIDLTDVTFMASVGLSILIEHNRLCREVDVELHVVAGNRTIVRTITMTGLDGTLAVFATLAEALAPAS
jgi:anti-sigma B factor antagonist